MPVNCLAVGQASLVALIGIHYIHIPAGNLNINALVKCKKVIYRFVTGE